MTLSTLTQRNEYTANGTQDTFAFTFRILAESDLEVYVGGALQTLNTHYTVSTGPWQTGGNVVFDADYIPAASAEVIIVRAIPRTQEVNLAEGAKMPAESLELALDRITMEVQDLRGQIQRSAKIPKTQVIGSTEVVFPKLVANKYPRVNSLGNGFDLVDLLSGVTGSTFDQDILANGDIVGDGSTDIRGILNITAKGPWTNVKAYGAKGDGVTDDSSAIASAVSAAAGKPVYFPYGNYKFTAAGLGQISTDVWFIGDNATLTGTSSLDFIRPQAGVRMRGITFKTWLSVIESEVATESGTIPYLDIEGCVFDTISSSTINVELAVTWVRIHKNRFKSTTGWTIRIGRNVYAEQDNWQDIFITNNIFNTITASGAADAAAGIVYGYRSTISHNIVFDVASASGPSYGFYTKCRNATIVGNTVINIHGGGAENTAFNVKGSGRGATVSPQGYDVVVVGNNIKTCKIGIRTQQESVLVAANVIDEPTLDGITADDEDVKYFLAVLNQIRFTSKTSTVGIRISANGPSLAAIMNVITGCGTGVRFAATSTGGKQYAAKMNTIYDVTNGIDSNFAYNASLVSITDNVVDTCGRGVLTQGAGTVDHIEISRNDVTNWSTAPMTIGGTLTNLKARDNRGYVTENEGTTGAIATGATVSHGLAGTPDNVVVTAQDSGPTDIYVTSKAATTFVINYGGGGTHVFSWRATMNRAMGN